MRRTDIFLLLLACGSSSKATLDLTVTPRQLANSGATANIRVVATDATGNVGVGKVKLTSTAGSLLDGLDVDLDAFGVATGTFSCNVTVDALCAGQVTIRAEWAAQKVVEEAIVNVTVAAGGGDGGMDAGSSSFDSIACPPAQAGVYSLWVSYDGTQIQDTTISRPKAMVGPTCDGLAQPGCDHGMTLIEFACSGSGVSCGGSAPLGFLLSTGVDPAIMMTASPIIHPTIQYNRIGYRLLYTFSANGSMARFQCDGTSNVDKWQLPNLAFGPVPLPDGGVVSGLTGFLYRFRCQNPKTTDMPDIHKVEGCIRYGP